MRDILSDLVAEQQSLDQYLQALRDRDWARATPAAGWDVRDSVSHLAHIEEHAFAALEGAEPPGPSDYPSFDAFVEGGVARGRVLPPGRVIEWWREARARTVEALSRVDAGRRIPWLGSTVRPATLATLRIMETWAHGLDIHHAMDDEPADTERLRHVAWLGWKTLPFAFSLAGEDYPHPVRVELFGPGYRKWSFGPEDTDQVIRGPAGEWCRVVVKRLPAAEAGGLKTIGAVAEKALRLARIFP